MSIRFSLVHEAIGIASLAAELDNPAAGAVVTFEGRVRNHNAGEAVSHLEYQAYPALALATGQRILEEEVARHGVTANAVCPGYVETDIVARAAENIAAKTKLNEDEARASLYAGNPQGRLIQPEEVASLIGWLCSDGAAATNGAALPISGGQI